MLTHFNLAERFDGAIFTSGPTYSDLKWACGQQCDGLNGFPPGVPDVSEGCFDAASRWGVDLAYGQPFNPKFEDLCQTMGDPEGTEACGEANFNYPCMQHEHEIAPGGAFDQTLLKESIALDLANRDYTYTRPGLRFIYGDLDAGTSVKQQEIYFQVVDHNPNVQRLSLEGVGHEIPVSEAGRAAILDALVDFCSAGQP
jgi:hypothetical protein